MIVLQETREKRLKTLGFSTFLDLVHPRCLMVWPILFVLWPEMNLGVGLISAGPDDVLLRLWDKAITDKMSS